MHAPQDAAALVVGRVFRVIGARPPSFLGQPDRQWSWRAAIGAWLVVAFVFVVGSAFAGLSWVHTSELAEHGARATATIVKLELSNHGGCKYEYQVDGHNYVKSEERCGDERHVGDSVRITYLPSQPAVSTAGSPIGELGDGFFITVLVSTLLAVAVGRGPTRRFITIRRRRI
jgi:hypothetical protein